ncbi:hypothetical protein D3C73_1143640 [compost metagenome]
MITLPTKNAALEALPTQDKMNGPKAKPSDMLATYSAMVLALACSTVVRFSQVSETTMMISLNTPRPRRRANQVSTGTKGNRASNTTVAPSDSASSFLGLNRRQSSGKNGAIANTPNACMAALIPT